MQELVLKIEGKGYTHLEYRFFASLVRSKIENAFISTEKIILDFEEIHTISDSYADEVYAKLLWKFDLEEIRKKIVFQNTNTFIKSVIGNAVVRRLSSQVDE